MERQIDMFQDFPEDKRHVPRHPKQEQPPKYSVPDELIKLAELYRERGKVYGDNYKLHGVVMQALFPNGITLKTVDDHNRFGVFTQVVCKITRYANMFGRGGHEDSLDDASVYSQMLRELDTLIRRK